MLYGYLEELFVFKPEVINIVAEELKNEGAGPIAEEQDEQEEPKAVARKKKPIAVEEKPVAKVEPSPEEDAARRKNIEI